MRIRAPKRLCAISLLLATLSLAGCSAQVEGWVRDWSGPGQNRNKPGLADMKVTATPTDQGRLESEGVHSARSSASGRFVIRGLSKKSQYVFSVEAPEGWATRPVTHKTRDLSEGWLQEPLLAHPPRDIVIATSHCLTGAPLGGATVALGQDRQTTDANGGNRSGPLLSS